MKGKRIYLVTSLKRIYVLCIQEKDVLSYILEKKNSLHKVYVQRRNAPHAMKLESISFL